MAQNYKFAYPVEFHQQVVEWGVSGGYPEATEGKFHDYTIQVYAAKLFITGFSNPTGGYT
jgi:hypothetical protein